MSKQLYYEADHYFLFFLLIYAAGYVRPPINR